MKTEITINNVTYRVGDILAYKPWVALYEILAIGSKSFYVRTCTDLKIESIICFRGLGNWQIKKPTKLIRHEMWINIYLNGFDEFYYESMANTNKSDGCIETVYWVYEKEVEI
jgi:hypothetical protein